MTYRLLALLTAAGLALMGGPAPTVAAETPHAHQGGMTHAPAMAHGRAPGTSEGGPVATPREAGQSAFAAIAEIVALLRRDPATDWTTVDIERLRQHLIDMDSVTLRARVAGQAVAGGMRFDVTSDDAAVTASVRRMVFAHVATMAGTDGMEMRAEEIVGGARLTVTGPDEAMIRGLGFIGLMTVGMHHQSHHLALALGRDPHRH